MLPLRHSANNKRNKTQTNKRVWNLQNTHILLSNIYLLYWRPPVIVRIAKY